LLFAAPSRAAADTGEEQLNKVTSIRAQHRLTDTFYLRDLCASASLRVKRSSLHQTRGTQDASSIWVGTHRPVHEEGPLAP
jgi:hypothetical protein